MLHTRNSSCITSLWLHLHHDCIFYVLSSKNILMKQVVYQQPTCVCVKMEFMVGIISLSYEMYRFRGAVFVHLGPTQLCVENGVSIYT